MSTQPSLFVSHGSPMFAVEPGRLGPNLQQIGSRLRDVRAVLVVSPHWQTHEGIRVMGTAAPDTIHDFGGFPDILYSLEYTPPGAPDIAVHAAGLLRSAGFQVEMDDQRGLDHGAWVPLRYLFPDEDVPVFQVSLPRATTTMDALRMGEALAPLRAQGVLIVGSGSLTHNLYELGGTVRDPEYAQQFADWVDQAVLTNNTGALIDYRLSAPFAQRAHPTEEHYLPLLVAVGASNPDDTRKRIDGGMTYGTLSMDSFGWGLEAQATARRD